MPWAKSEKAWDAALIIAEHFDDVRRIRSVVDAWAEANRKK